MTKKVNGWHSWAGWMPRTEAGNRALSDALRGRPSRPEPQLSVPVVAEPSEPGPVIVVRREPLPAAVDLDDNDGLSAA